MCNMVVLQSDVVILLSSRINNINYPATCDPSALVISPRRGLIYFIKKVSLHPYNRIDSNERPSNLRNRLLYVVFNFVFI